MNNKIIHWLAAVAFFGIPVLLSSHAGFLQLTIGGVLNAAYLWVSQVVKPTQPIAY